MTGFGFLLFASQAFAQAAQQSAPGADEYSGTGMVWVLFRTVIVLGIVVALIYISLNWGLRKLMGAKALGVGPGRLVNVVERVTLDQKHALYVVKVSDEYLLLGGGEGSLNLVAKLDKETVEKLKAEKAGGQAISPFLQKLLTRKGGGTPPNA